MLKNWIKSSFYNNYFLLVWLIISVISCIFFYSCFYDLHRGADLTTMNDEWEHQSLSVNYAKGFGIFKLGGYTDFKDYHFDTYDYAFPFLKKIFIQYPTEYYHRACGFSIITGTLYKFTGTHPFNLRVFNFIIICLSWLIICYAHYLFGNNRKITRLLLLAFPLFIVANFSYINLIGDDTLTIFALSMVFISLLYWQKYPGISATLLLLLTLSFSVFIKSTLIFIPFFLLAISLFYKKKYHLVAAIFINIVLLFSAYVISTELNKKHRQYTYAPKEQFHADMIHSDWNPDDSAFIKKYGLKFTREDDNTDFAFYKIIATYLFERQFYTQRMFILSGQSWFLLIDGNNETCAWLSMRYSGNWGPTWRFNTGSFYYHYDENTSPITQIVRFYLHKPLYFPKIIFFKWLAGYNWSALFFILSFLQITWYLLLRYKIRSYFQMIKIAFILLLLFIALRQLHFTPLILLGYIISFFLLYKRNKKHYTGLHTFYYAAAFIILYFIFLTSLMFGLDRYTGIANGMFLIGIIQLLYLFYEENKKVIRDAAANPKKEK